MEEAIIPLGRRYGDQVRILRAESHHLARVSTKDKGQNTENQLQRLQLSSYVHPPVMIYGTAFSHSCYRCHLLDSF
jgi:hypothetical protein